MHRSKAPLVFLVASLVAPHPTTAQQNPFSLDGLIVSTSPTPRAAESVASHVTVLNREDLAWYSDRSLGEILRDVAGVSVARSGGFGAVTSVFMRGGESDYTLVMVDGVQVNRAGGGFDFAALSTDNIERIEIVRGPASALYGSDAVTGVIHVITRAGRGAPRITGSGQAGSFGRRDWQVGVLAGTDRAAFSVSVAHRDTDGLLAFNNRSVNRVLSGRASVIPDDDTEVGVTLRLTDRTFHFPTDGSGAVVDRNAFTFGTDVLAQASVRRALSSRVSARLAVGVSDTDGGTDDRQDEAADTLGFYGFASLDHFRRATGDLRVTGVLAAGEVTAGVEVENESQRSFSESASQFGPSTGHSSEARDNAAGYLHGTVATGPIAWTAGARAEDNERFGTMATWQLGAAFLAWESKGTRLRGSAGTGIKEPTFFENFASGFATGNPDLNPERSTSWEVGLEQPLHGERLTVRGTYFDQSFRDLIQYTFTPPVPNGPNYFNVAAARAAGVELEVLGRLGPVDFGVERTWLDTEVTDSGFDEGPGASFIDGEALLRRPADQWSLRAATDLESWGRAFVRVAGVGQRADRDFSTFPATAVSLEGYTTASLGGEVDVPAGGARGVDLTFTVLAENVFDTVYEDVLGFFGPGRALYVGVRLGLGGAGN